MNQTNNTTDLKGVIADLGGAFEDFKSQYGGRLDNVETLLARGQAPYGGGQGSAEARPFGSFSVMVEGQQLPLLRRTDSAAAYFASQRPSGDDQFSLASFVRSRMGLEGPKALGSDTATVPNYVSTQIIDAVRAASRIVEAGAGTIIIPGPTNLAKITADPVVYQHTEGATDVSESAPTLAAVAANPKTLIAAVPLPMELVEDSPNLDAALQMSLAAAFASKLDSLGLATILADSTIPTSSVGQDPATWAGVLAAVAEALAADQLLPGAFVGSEADFIARASQLASTAGSWLGKPPALAEMRELFTTKVTAGTGIFGDWLQGFAVIVRQELRLEVLRLQKYTSGQHILVAHARMDGIVLQPGRLFIQEATVV